MKNLFASLGRSLLTLFVVLVAAYQVLVQKPLRLTLAERRARTEGAVENAHKAIAQAEAKAAEYSEKLRLARAEIFKMREKRAKQRNAERETALDAARRASGAKVSQAKAEIDGEAERARQVVQGSAGELANQVVQAVLPLPAGSSR